MNRQDLSEEVRQTLHRYDAPHDSHYGVLPGRPPEESVKLENVAPAIARAHASLAEASLIAKQLPDQYILSRIPVRMEALSSSSIEGTNSTLDELLEFEEEDAVVSSETSQVRDYAVALEQVIPLAKNKGRRVFTVDLISQLHVATMRSDPTYKDVPGELRSSVVFIGPKDLATSTFNPPAPGYVKSCMDQHVHYLRADDGEVIMKQDFMTRLAIAHAHFEAVHPFRDGNGRVGRQLLAVMMAAEGYEPVFLSPYIEVNKPAYVAALKDAQQRLNYSPLITLLANAVVDAVQEIKRTRDALVTLQNSWLAKTKFRADSAARSTLDLLHAYPVLTMRRLEDLLGVSFPAARNAVNLLVASGILVEKTGYSRNRIFTAPEAVKVLNRNFASFDNGKHDDFEEDGVSGGPGF
jgi:Fic family protein